MPIRASDRISNESLARFQGVLHESAGNGTRGFSELSQLSAVQRFDAAFDRSLGLLFANSVRQMHGDRLH